VLQEKMASLGQLTAGIAHEIKNPLNFVNSFARLSVGLTRELAEDIGRARERLDPETLERIDEDLRDLSFNAGKIEEHGKRADSIVQAMLLHSRGVAGTRQPSDLNALVQDSVALAYHGMRARDFDIEVTIEAVYDPTIGLVELVPQEIASVVLNLVNNACYAAHERKRSAGDGFVPTLTVTTKRKGDSAAVHVRDNGMGIPKSVLDRIFDPFFTTKPAGQGTGLGLSMSYGVMTQHGGTIRVETREGEFTTFIVTLPAPDRTD
jgi:signal transduction histidine kinase